MIAHLLSCVLNVPSGRVLSSLVNNLADYPVGHFCSLYI